ncbi:hypothetical protein [Borealpox virus]|nr:hypothetical protein [Alaskapox virus]
MDKLYAAIFGVFMGSPEDDLTEFIEIVKSVLSDEKIPSTNSSGCWGWCWLVISFFIVVILLLLICLYLKVV